MVSDLDSDFLCRHLLTMVELESSLFRSNIISLIPFNVTELTNINFSLRVYHTTK